MFIEIEIKKREPEKRRFSGYREKMKEKGRKGDGKNGCSKDVCRGRYKAD